MTGKCHRKRDVILQARPTTSENTARSDIPVWVWGEKGHLCKKKSFIDIFVVKEQALMNKDQNMWK